VSRRAVILSLVFAGIAISYIDRGALSIAAPSMMRDFRIAPGQMGILLSAFFWTYGAFQIPAGALVDRFGIRRAYAGGFLIWSIASASIALSRGPGDIIGSRMVLGLAESIGPLASLSFIRSHYAGKDQGLPTSIYIAGQNIGPALGALIGTILLDRFGWRMMFALTGLGALVWLPCWLFAVPADQAAVRQAEKTIDAPVPAHRWQWRMLAGRWSFWAMSFCSLLASYYWYFVLTWIPSYLVLARGFSTLGMGRVISTALFTMAAVNILAGALADKLAQRLGVFRVRLLFVVSGYSAAAAVLLLLVAPDPYWVVPILTFSMCATGIGNSNFWAIAQHLPPKHAVGRSVGYLNTLSQMAGAAAPVLTGWMLGPRKEFGIAILVAGFCPLLAAACLARTGREGLERTKALLSGEMTLQARRGR
jgi:ACS family D-galactonate transporter-like MFS transporter